MADYAQRVTQIFGKINSLQGKVEEEKENRYDAITALIEAF